MDKPKIIPELVTFPSVPENSIVPWTFSRGTFERLCTAPSASGSANDHHPLLQVDYIARYLQHLECTVLFVERHYVDKDYRADFGRFYAQGLAGYPPYCQRIHCFRSEVSAGALFTKIRRQREQLAGLDASQLAKQLPALQARISSDYLGFVVVRPLPRAPIGRTVLRPPHAAADNEGLRIHTARPHPVHFMGVELTVEGVEFAQQDHAGSACATVALWTALHTLKEPRGVPTTPADITTFATEQTHSYGRVFPPGSRSLTLDQMCDAVGHVGFTPYLISHGDEAPTAGRVRNGSAQGSRETLLAHLVVAIASPLPCVAIVDKLLAEEKDYHAVAVLGGELTGDPVRKGDAETGLKTLFLHDDLLGPYAQADLVGSRYMPLKKANALLREEWRTRYGSSSAAPRIARSDVAFMVEDRGSSGLLDVYVVRALLMPLPPDVHLTPGDLLRLSIRHVVNPASTAVPESNAIGARVRIRPAAAYIKELLFQARGLDAEQRQVIASTLALSRYVGVVHLEVEGRRVCDIVFDTTTSDLHPTPLAVIGFSPDGARPVAERVFPRLIECWRDILDTFFKAGPPVRRILPSVLS